MDHGTLTASNGRQANFRHVVINIWTSNAGIKEMALSSI